MLKDETSLLLNEEIFRRLLTHKVLGKKMSSRIISDVLGFDYNVVLKNIRVVERNISISTFSVDYLVKNILPKNTLLIDIRLSYTSTEFLSFLYELNMDLFNYSKRKMKMIQIFIDSKDRFRKDKCLYNVCCMEKNEYVCGNRFYEKYYINLDYIRKISYKMIIHDKNKVNRLFHFFVYDNKRLLEELYAGDELMLKVLREMKKIYLHEDIPLYYENEYIELKYLYEEYFLNDAINLGMIEEKKRMIKSLYDNGATLDLIRRATNISLDEVKKIIEQETIVNL